MNALELNRFTPGQVRIAKGWFYLGIFSLLASGIFSLLLVLSRTPLVSEIIPWIDFFHTALVVHVDLSVLMWFLSFTAIFWSLNNRGSYPVIDNIALLGALSGTLLLIATPFTGQAHPIINNYVPVLDDPPFLVGLAIIGASFALLSIRSLFDKPGFSFNQTLSTGIQFSVITLVVTLAVQVYTYVRLPAIENRQVYFEYLFWGSGHTLQFSHVLLLLVTWLWISSQAGARYHHKPALYTGLLALCFAPVLVVPVIYASFPVFSSEHLVSFTGLMRWGGLTAVPLGVLIAIKAFRLAPEDDRQKPIANAFFWSVVLFATGGILGFLIEGVNVVIPAHYHGSIVGVTLAFMGMSYLLLPIFGLEAPSGRLARYQPAIYGVGQMMHIIGLAWSGGYGVQRKTAGAAQGLDSLAQKAGMGLMGLGGLVAIIGGTLFLVIVLIAIYRK